MSHVTIEATGKGIKAAFLVVWGGLMLNGADCVSNGPTGHTITAFFFGMVCLLIIKAYRWWEHG